MSQLVTPPASGEVDARTAVAGGNPLSERKQARTENWRLIRRRPSFIIGSIVVLFWTACAILGERITPRSPFKPLYGVHERPGAKFLFGTDKTGRDVLSRVMMGARDILKVAPLAAVLSVILGVILGMVMGYFRGWVDLVLGRIVEAPTHSGEKLGEALRANP